MLLENIPCLLPNVLDQFLKLCELLGIGFVIKKPNTFYVLINGFRINMYDGDKSTDFEKFRGANRLIIVYE
ncbi:hypothetical protein [Candidatus Borreliella tachyglossi]|uniref:hypothetical protein n=1 Tax=Candidatus Borreliella tachyglossi TaxID=1964448 RepID=UPI004041DD92